MSEELVTVQLLFVDEGSYHREEIRIPGDTVDRYERLIDLLQEDPEVLRRTFVDLDRLCSAAIKVEEGD
jgi:hypothetical protein